MTISIGLPELRKRLPELVTLVVAYREALQKTGIPAEDIRQMVSFFQASIVGRIMDGERLDPWERP